jgi:hypothetical protein
MMIACHVTQIQVNTYSVGYVILSALRSPFCPLTLIFVLTVTILVRRALDQSKTNAHHAVLVAIVSHPCLIKLATLENVSDPQAVMNLMVNVLRDVSMDYMLG